MKLFIALSAVVLVASALPTEIGSQAKNGSRFDTYGLQGFGHRTIGGINGAVWTVWDAFALRTALNSAEPRIIYVRGRIDLLTLFTGSPGVSLPVGPYKSILGGDRDAEIFGGGLSLNGQVHVIIADIKFNNAMSFANGEQPDGNGGIISMINSPYSEIDAIDITRSEHVWVNHCEFSDDPWISPAPTENQRRHDGLIDIKRAANWISISNNIFRNHNHVTLVGHNDNNAAQDVGTLKVSFYNNWYRGVHQRNPRVRYGEVHIFNNLYTDISSYGAGVGAGAQIYFERNVCVNSRRCWGFASGVPSPAGHLLAENNLMNNSGFDTGVPNSVGFRPNQHYGYSALAVGNVEAHVRAWAGPRL